MPAPAGMLTTINQISFRGQGITLNNFLGVDSAGAQILSDLDDVTEVIKQDGVMLQWEANTSQYEINFVSLDGGTF